VFFNVSWISWTLCFECDFLGHCAVFFASGNRTLVFRRDLKVLDSGTKTKKSPLIYLQHVTSYLLTNCLIGFWRWMLCESYNLFLRLMLMIMLLCVCCLGSKWRNVFTGSRQTGYGWVTLRWTSLRSQLLTCFLRLHSHSILCFVCSVQKSYEWFSTLMKLLLFFKKEFLYTDAKFIYFWLLIDRIQFSCEWRNDDILQCIWES